MWFDGFEGSSSYLWLAVSARIERENGNYYVVGYS